MPKNSDTQELLALESMTYPAYNVVPKAVTLPDGDVRQLMLRSASPLLANAAKSKAFGPNVIFEFAFVDTFFMKAQQKEVDDLAGSMHIKIEDHEIAPHTMIGLEIDTAIEFTISLVDMLRKHVKKHYTGTTQEELLSKLSKLNEGLPVNA